jgi:hypothetical protein
MKIVTLSPGGGRVCDGPDLICSQTYYREPHTLWGRVRKAFFEILQSLPQPPLKPPSGSLPNSKGNLSGMGDRREWCGGRGFSERGAPKCPPTAHPSGSGKQSKEKQRLLHVSCPGCHCQDSIGPAHGLCTCGISGRKWIFRTDSELSDQTPTPSVSSVGLVIKLPPQRTQPLLL